VIAWRKDLEHRQLSGTSIGRKLSAPSLFDYLCEANAVTQEQQLIRLRLPSPAREQTTAR